MLAAPEDESQALLGATGRLADQQAGKVPGPPTAKSHGVERVLGLVVACVLAAGVVAAVVQRDAGADADVLLVAAERTAEAGSARVWLRTEAVFSGEAGRQIEAMGMPTVFEFEGVLDFSGPAHLRSPQLELLQTGDATYFTVHATGEPSLFEALATGLEGRWLRAETEVELGVAGLPAMAEAGDPAGVLDLLTAVGEVEAAGEGEVRGDRVRHYTVTDIDREALARLFSDTEAVAHEAREVLALGVSVDDDGLIRRVDLDVEVAAPFPDTDGEPYRELTALEWWDFGVAVDVQAPPPEHTISHEELGEALFAQQMFLPAEASAELCPVAGRLDELLGAGRELDPAELEDLEAGIAAVYRTIDVLEASPTVGSRMAGMQLRGVVSMARLVQLRAAGGGRAVDEATIAHAREALSSVVAVGCQAG